MHYLKDVKCAASISQQKYLTFFAALLFSSLQKSEAVQLDYLIGLSLLYQSSSTMSVDAPDHAWLRVFFLAGNMMMTQKTNGGTPVCLPDEHTHIHTLLGYNVASAQPHFAAKSESNILRSPHVAQVWPWPQMEITHHCNTVRPSVCSLSVCLRVSLSVNMSACLASDVSVRISVYISVSTCLAAWLWIFPPVCMSAMCRLLFICLCLSVCRCVRQDTHTVWLSSAFLPICSAVCVCSSVCLSLPQP